LLSIENWSLFQSNLEAAIILHHLAQI